MEKKEVKGNAMKELVEFMRSVEFDKMVCQAQVLAKYCPYIKSDKEEK